MVQQKYKRNHYVPKAYLRNFAADMGREKIWTFGISGGDPKLKPLSKVAVKFHLYTPMDGDKRDYRVEHKLGGLEQLFGLDFWQRISTDYIDLSDKTIRKGIALLTAVMYLRNPCMLDQSGKIYNQIRSFYMEANELPDAIEIAGQKYDLDGDSWPSYRDASEDDIKRMWLGSLEQATWLAELLLDMRWAVIVSDQPKFITSDNPVVLTHPSMVFRGFKDLQTSVLFPLSPTRLLHLDHRHSEPDGQYYPVRGNGEAQNMLLWHNATRDIYSHRHPAQMCEEIASFADGLGE